MKVRAYADAPAAGRAAASEVGKLIGEKPDAVLGLATGHTMIPVYGELVRLHERGRISLKKAVTFNLDEYAGLGRGDEDSLYEFMALRLLGQVDLPRESFHIIDGKAPDLEAECGRFEAAIKRAGGIDLQFLGLGRNGHIGFNEPGSDRNSRTRVVDLAAKTRKINVRDFRRLDETPKQGATVGIATILEARRIVMVVTGWEKNEILHKVLTSPPAPEIPATFLHEHNDVLVIADQQALEVYFESKGRAASFEAPVP